MVSETVAPSVAQGLWVGVLLFWDEGTAVCSTRYSRRRIVHLEHQKHTRQAACLQQCGELAPRLTNTPFWAPSLRFLGT